MAGLALESANVLAALDVRGSALAAGTLRSLGQSTPTSAMRSETVDDWRPRRPSA